MPKVYQRHLHEFSTAVQARANPQVEGHFPMSGPLRARTCGRLRGEQNRTSVAPVTPAGDPLTAAE